MGVFGRDPGAVRREERPVEPFDQVRLDGIGQVEIALGEADRVVVEAADDVLERVVTRVERGVLVLEQREGHFWRSWKGVQIRFEITMRSVRGLAIDGSGSIHAARLHSDSFAASIDGAGEISVGTADVDRLHVSIDGAGRVALESAKAREARVVVDGAGTVDLGRLQADEAEITIDGHGRVAGSGTVNRLAIRIDGTGKAETHELEARSVDVRIDGVGKVTTHAVESLDVRIDGFGRVEYAGNPRIHQSMGGAGRVARLV